MTVRPALVLTGPPAVGKSRAALSLAGTRTQCAVIEVDDLRQLVRVGAAAPWEGAAGARQHRLGVRNACAVASNFLSEGIDALITDVLTSDTARTYRALLPGCVVVRLTATLEETTRRAASRHERLTVAEFDALHQQDQAQPAFADLTIDATHLDPLQQVRAIELAWVDGPG